MPYWCTGNSAVEVTCHGYRGNASIDQCHGMRLKGDLSREPKCVKVKAFDSE